MLERRLQAVTSTRIKGHWGITCAVMDVGELAVCTLPALTFLDLSFRRDIMDVAVMTVSGMTSLRSLNLSFCFNITYSEVLAVSGMTALTTLDLFYCYNLTNEGVLTLSSQPALAHMNLRYYDNVTAAGVQALRSTTTAHILRIQHAFLALHSNSGGAARCEERGCCCTYRHLTSLVSSVTLRRSTLTPNCGASARTISRDTDIVPEVGQSVPRSSVLLPDHRKTSGALHGGPAHGPSGEPTGRRVPAWPHVT